MSDPIQTTPGCNTDLVDGQSLVESLLRENKALKEQNALLTVQVQEGWKLVPDASNMTDEQAEAIANIANCCGGIAYDIYRAALAAAPTLPQQVKSDGVLDEPPQYYYSVDNPDYGYECYDDMDVIGFMPVGTEYEMTACWYQNRKYRVVKVADEVDDNHTVIDITEYAAISAQEEKA